MSLEDTMKALAESNLKLAESNNKQAAALDNYVEFCKKGGGAATGNTNADAAASSDKPARGKPGPKPKDTPAPAADADDGFGDEGGEEAEAQTFTAEDVKNKLMEVKDAYGDKAPALKVINDLGYKAIPDVQPKDYGAVMAECAKLLKKKGK